MPFYLQKAEFVFLKRRIEKQIAAKSNSSVVLTQNENITKTAATKTKNKKVKTKNAKWIKKSKNPKNVFPMTLASEKIPGPKSWPKRANSWPKGALEPKNGLFPQIGGKYAFSKFHPAALILQAYFGAKTQKWRKWPKTAKIGIFQQRRRIAFLEYLAFRPRRKFFDRVKNYQRGIKR